MLFAPRSARRHEPAFSRSYSFRVCSFRISVSFTWTDNGPRLLPGASTPSGLCRRSRGQLKPREDGLAETPNREKAEFAALVVQKKPQQSMIDQLRSQESELVNGIAAEQ